MANRTRNTIETTINVPGPWEGVVTEVLATPTYILDPLTLEESTRYGIHEQLKDRPYVYYSGKYAISCRFEKRVIKGGFKSVREARDYVYAELGERFTEEHRQASLNRRFGKTA